MVRSTGSEPSLPFFPTIDGSLQPLAFLESKFEEQEAQIIALSHEMRAYEGRVEKWSVEQRWKEPVMALRICLADLSFSEPSSSFNPKVAQRRQAQAQQCQEEKVYITHNLMDLNVRARAMISEISIAFGSGASKWRGDRISIQSKSDGLSWGGLEDAVRLRSMRISALSGFIGSLRDIEAEVAVETERADYIVCFINGVRSNVANEKSRLLGELPEAKKASQAQSQQQIPLRHIPVTSFFSLDTQAAMSSFPSWQEGPIAKAAWGRRS